MTTAAHTPAPIYTVSGTGPYAIPHAYSAAADISVRVFTVSASTVLDPADYSVAPDSSNTTGAVTLTSAAATTHAGKSLEILRSTPAVQSYQAVTSQREKQLEAVLDVLVRAQQDIERLLEKSLRFDGEVAQLTATADTMLLFDDSAAPYLADPNTALGLTGILADIADLEARVALATGISPAAPLSVSIGGTGASTAGGARGVLQVPGLATDDTVTGDWTITGEWTFSGAAMFTSLVTVPTLAASTINVESGGSPRVRVIDSDTANEVQFKANNTAAVIAVDPGDTVASSTIDLEVDGAQVLRASPTGVDITGAIEADSLGAGMETLVDARVAAESPVQAWVNFNGTGTVAIRDSFNVASITDHGTGDYTINFNTTMPNTNYAVIGSASNDVGGFRAVAPLTYGTSSIRINVRNSGNSLTDAEFVNVAILC